MPIIDHFERVLGDSPQALAVPEGSDAGLLICFVSSTDPATKQPWCSDHRAAIPVLEATFAKESQPEVRLVHVGQRTEYKTPGSYYRRAWNINNVPTLARYERVDGAIKETRRLVEEEILNKEKLQAFLS